MRWFRRRPAAETSRNNDPHLPLIRLERVTRTFKGEMDEETRAFSDVTVDIHRGEYGSVSGPSGCGKSTFLSLLALLDTRLATHNPHYIARAQRHLYLFDGRMVDAPVA